MKSATAAKPSSLLKVANRAQVWANIRVSQSAQAFRDPKARARMLDVAVEYERKAKQTEASEIQKPQNK